MNCSNCGQVIADESLGFCMECGEAFGTPEGQEAPAYADSEEGAYPEYGDGEGQEAWSPPRPSPWEVLARVLAPVRAAVAQVGGVFADFLENPALTGQMPGGSLTFLGLGLVGLALLASWVPLVQGIGWQASGVMLVGGVLVGVSEWRETSEAPPREGRFVNAFPAWLDGLPQALWQPGLIQAYALLTCVFALKMVGYGPLALVWLLAAGVLGYEQGRRFFFLLEQDEPALEASLAQPSLHRWVVLGVTVCTVAMLLPWERTRTFDPSILGGDLPLAPLTQFMLLLLGCYAVKHQGLGGVHPLVLVLSAV